MAVLGLSAADQAALARIQRVVAEEAEDATGFLAGFLECLGEHLAVMGANAPAPFA